MDLSYIINHLGEDRENYLNAGAPPIFQTSNFIFQNSADMRHALAHEMDQPFYTRGHNPTVAMLRKKLAALEGAEECLIFASGSAAIASGVMSLLEAGDHVVCVQKPYSWTNKLFTLLLPRFGVETTFVDGRDPEAYREAIRPNTKLLYLESPNSLTFELQDIEAIVAIAREKGIYTAIDNSFATPLNQQPITMGVDLVFHSASKYIGGHSDVVAGVLCCSREMAEQIFASEFMTLGGIISPNDAWLLMRGLRTLPIRMERVSVTTPLVVASLEDHPAVEEVYYPFSPSHPQYELAVRQMKHPTGQFSVALRAKSVEEMDAFCDRLQYFMLGCSWGGFESLAFPMSVLVNSANYSGSVVPWNVVRFYAGLEDPHLLIEDLRNALEAITIEGH